MPELYGAEIFPGRELITSDIEIIRSNKAIDYLGQGAEGTVTRVIVRREGREEVMTFKETNEQVSTLESNVIVRDILFNAGIPTLEQYVLVFEDGKAIGILMEDLTEGGRNFILSSNEMKLIRYTLRNLVIKNYTLVAAIASIEDTVIDELSRRLEEYAYVATNVGILFEQMDFLFWVITPQGTVRPVVADLGAVEYNTSEPVANVELCNMKRLRDSVNQLIRLRDLAIETIQSCM